MRAILTPLFFFASLVMWGQAELPFAQTPPHIIDDAVEAWQANASEDVAQDVTAYDQLGLSFRGDRSTITSVQRGIWSEAATWDCDCVPGGDDNVVVDHEVSFVEDAEFSSVMVSATGTLVDLANVTLTFDGNFVSSTPLTQLASASLAANGIAMAQTLAADLTVANLSATLRSALTVQGHVKVTGHVNIDDASILVHEDGALTLSENEMGRATVARTSGGTLTGLVTREITLPATPNRNMAFVEQRIATGLEGVTVQDFVGDIPTWGFAGADNPAGFANIGYWSATADYNYEIIASTADTLPVWEGVYLALAPAASYTLTFTGTMPANDVVMDIPGDAFTALFGNPTNANVDLQTLETQFGESKVGLDCWNTNTLQYDHYVDGLSTNGLQATLQPNTTCQYLPTTNASVVMAFAGTMPNGTMATPNVALDGRIAISAENASGFRDETVIGFREGASVSFDESEDAINTSSLYSACDLYLRDGESNRSAIAQLGFDNEPMMEFDIVLGANRPLDGTYTLSIDDFEWEEGCAFLMLADDTEPRALEAGELTTVTLASDQNHNYTVGTLFLVPPVRAAVTSPGCEGTGEASIDVLATGDGPWTVALNDDQGNVLTGTADETGAVTTFADLASGMYTFAVISEGTMTCGSTTGAHTVIKPTALTIATDVTHDCGEGGAVVAVVESEAVTFVWSDGQEGPVASGLSGSIYTVIATNAFGCKDTTSVEVLTSPEVTIVTTDGTCDGDLDADIQVNADHETALYNATLRDANGNLAGQVMNAPTPMFFEGLATGTYSVELELLGDYGCAPETHEASIVQPVPMTLTATSAVQCDVAHPGSATANLVGGTGQVTYTWSNGATGADLDDAAPGEYTVTVTDEAGCQETTAVTVTASPSLDVTVLSPGCDGEGQTGFSMASDANVTWTVNVEDAEGALVQSTTTPSAAFDMTGMPSGMYTVTYSHDVEDGCPAKSMEAQLMEASNLQVDVTVTPMGCGDIDAGAIDLAIEGGLGDVSIAWDHGATGTSLTNLAGGQYYAVVTDDNGCTKDVRVEVEDTPTVEANFTAPTGGLTDGVNGMTLSFTNTSEGNITGQTWYFGDTDTPNYDYHATHTFDEPGAYDVFLNVWNDKCSHTVRKTVVVTQGETNPNNDDLGTLVTSVAEGDLTEIHAPVTTESGWMMDLGAAADGMKIHVFDLTGRQLCTPVGADGSGQIWIEGDQWPALVLLRLVHEPTNSVRTWKMVR